MLNNNCGEEVDTHRGCGRLRASCNENRAPCSLAGYAEPSIAWLYSSLSSVVSSRSTTLPHRLPTPAETGSGGRGCAHGLVRALWDDSVSAFLSRSSCMAGVRQLVEMFALLAGFQLRLAGCPSTQIVHALLRRKGPRACERTRTLALLSGCKTVSVSTWSCFASLPSSRLGSSESLRSVL